jgi:hypothetical protein
VAGSVKPGNCGQLESRQQEGLKVAAHQEEEAEYVQGPQEVDLEGEGTVGDEEPT